MSAPVPGPPRPGSFGPRPTGFPPRPAAPAGQPQQPQQPQQTRPGAAWQPQPASRPSVLPVDDVDEDGGDGSGHPAVDAVLGSLANAAQLAPADQVAEYEAAHRVLQETLAGIDRA